MLIFLRNGAHLGPIDNCHVVRLEMLYCSYISTKAKNRILLDQCFLFYFFNAMQAKANTPMTIYDLSLDLQSIPKTTERGAF